MLQKQKFAIGYLVFCGVFAWGILIGHYKWFPFEAMRNVKAIILDINFYNNFLSDWGGVPYRFLYAFEPETRAGLTELKVPNLKARRASPLLRLSLNAPQGDRILFGAFDFKDAFWGAILIDSKGRVKHTWRLSTEELPLNSEPDVRKNMSGVDIQPDGSIIFSMQEAGGGIVKVDYCSNVIWTLDGKFHHIISPTGEGTFWTFEGSQVTFDHIASLIDMNSGKVLKRIRFKDVRAANPNTHIFDLQKKEIENTDDASHGNDIDPLPEHLVSAFPLFAHSDLLVSFKMTNLVFILEPNTLKIKWWRIGPWNRQHDADWNSGGYISVFNNNVRVDGREHRGVDDGKFSNIIAIDPQSLETEILLTGSKYNFYSRMNGMHEVTRAGTILVTSSTQGRIFEVNGDGEIVFDFINRFNNNRALHVSDARYLGLNYFQPNEPPCL